MATKILKKQLPWDRTICTQLEMVDLSGNSYVCNAIEQMQKEHEQLKKFKEWVDEVAEEILGTDDNDMRECLSDMFFHRIVG